MQIAELRKWLDQATEKNTALTKEKNVLEHDLSEMEKRLQVRERETEAETGTETETDRGRQRQQKTERRRLC